LKSTVKNLKDKERRGNTGSIEEFKKKKEMLGDGEGVKEDIFKRSNKTKIIAHNDDKGRNMVQMLKEWKEKMKREMKEGMRGIREEIKKIAEEQKEELKKEVEGIREELRAKEEN